MTVATATLELDGIEAAGDLDAELNEFMELQDMQDADGIRTWWSYFPTCCS